MPWDGESTGEVEVRGPWIAREYYEDPSGADKFHDGWLRTGDVASIDPQGFLRITDRAKDLIKSGGEWISSVELENALMSHPDVMEAAVIAKPDERWTERPLACVVCREGSNPTPEELRAHLEPLVAKWWLPDDYAFIEAVPKTSVGKFDKKVLRAQLAEGALGHGAGGDRPAREVKRPTADRRLPTRPAWIQSRRSGAPGAGALTTLMHATQDTAAEKPGSRKIRVVVAKPGLDGHDRGAKIIARTLRDAGMEVIYTGLHQTPEQIAETVIQEDADVVGLSILSGAHMTLVPRVVDLLKAKQAEDVVVILGGTIPADDIPELKRLGVSEIFTPGASTQDIVEFVRGAVSSS